MALKEGVEQQLQRDYRAYTKEVRALAVLLFMEHVRPLCEERKYMFLVVDGRCKIVETAGLGTFHAKDAKDNQELWDVMNLLKVEVPGTGSRLGDFMPEYCPPGTEEAPV